ncbi:MAG: 4'-phosphopantetheinyl transferase superfamily protein [Clostridia bacterium]|nr:4'-phosphopantetheinyl transferase superfamily protein [Clostridia bacterium]
MSVIRIYAEDCTPYLDEKVAFAALPWLDEKRRSRVRRLRVPLKRAQCVAAGLLLTHLFGEGGHSPTLYYGAHGKPYLKGDGACFSLSHTDRWVFCAVSEHNVGMDSQRCRPISTRLIARTLTPEEQTWLDSDREHRYLRLWTMKEAYLKYTGTGLSTPLCSVSLSVPPADGFDEALGICWHFPSFSDSEITLTVCGDDALCSTITVISSNDL